VKQFLQADDVRPGGGSLADPSQGFLNVLPLVACAAHLHERNSGAVIFRWSACCVGCCHGNCD
jgi:hypothetical protein